MEANLISLTKPSSYTNCNTAEELVVWCARISNPANQNNLETAPKLIRYLINNKHWSPFEQVSIGIEIKTSRDIARQLLRHKFKFQEFSQRYADPTKSLGFQTREGRLQDNKNRQNSIDTGDHELLEEWIMIQTDIITASSQAYTWAIENGIAKEQARAVLPEGLTDTVIIATGDLRNWIHYLEVRCDLATQKEHREVSNKCRSIIAGHFPNVAEALEWPT